MEIIREFIISVGGPEQATLLSLPFVLAIVCFFEIRKMEKENE